MKFTYRWGQRPLAGYTIKRGLGQGGFGEVYFAVSDGGKEVALKLLLRGRTETELRGISNCLNLKHPNLVHLYDLRIDERGDQWLVMEYVQGEPLSGVLNRTSGGLPVEKARAWFLQTAEAVAYLHDHAVIHRDIKPGNVFVESGTVKLGDYGLSKSTASDHLTQSANVGTVYYMAPEVGKGACTKQVDIYALGVMLYELLTGEVPFRGDSWAEIALRHQTELPEFSKIPPGYLPIIEKALRKKPEERFADVAELMQAVRAIDAPTTAVQLATAPIALEARDNVGTKDAAAVPTMRGPGSPPPLPRREPPPLPKQSSAVAVPGKRERVAELMFSLAGVPFAAVSVVAAWMLVQGIFSEKVNWYSLIPLYVVTSVTAWLTLIPAKIRERNRHVGGHWTMAGMGVLIGLLVFWLEGWPLPTLVADGSAAPPEREAYFAGAVRAAPGVMHHLIAYPLLFAVGLGMIGWRDYCHRRRKERFSLGPVFAAGFVAFLCWVGWQIGIRDYEPPTYLLVALAGTAGVLQLVSPWTPPPPPAPKKRRLRYA